jgi:hypothetical protein
MTSRSRHLTYKVVLFGGVLLLLGYVAFEWHRKANKAPPPAISVTPRTAQSKLTIKGMNYSASYGGKLLLVMRVSSVELGKKKMGFFRVGGLRQIELKGLEVDYYEPVAEERWGAGHQEDPRDISSGILTAAQSFIDSKGRLAGLQARRLKFHYHHTDGTTTDIEGDLLELERGGNILRIRGHAEVHHDGRSLSSDEVFFHPQDKTFFTKKNYTLTASGASEGGNEIRTDLRLNPLPEKSGKNDPLEKGEDSDPVDSRTKHSDNKQTSDR